MKINLTKLEADALWDTSGQMEDDFTDYYSFMGTKKMHKFHEAFCSARLKLASITQSKKMTNEPNSELSVARDDAQRTEPRLHNLLEQRDKEIARLKEKLEDLNTPPSQII